MRVFIGTTLFLSDRVRSVGAWGGGDWGGRGPRGRAAHRRAATRGTGSAGRPRPGSAGGRGFRRGVALAVG